MSYTPRSDSWAGSLTEVELCDIYRRSMGVATDELPQFFEWILKQYPAVARKPSQTSFYAWKKLFKDTFNEHERNEARDAGKLVAEYAKANIVDDEQYIAALKAIGSKAMVVKDHKTMALCLTSAMELTASLQRRLDLEIKERAQSTREADLALAREKFEAAEKRLSAAQKTVTDETLTDAERITKIKSIFGLS